MPLLEPPTQFPRAHLNTTKTPVTITATGTNTKGTWTQVIADIGTEDAHGFWVYADGMGVTATITGGLLDIGFGPAGGADPGSNVNLVPDLNVGWSGTAGAAVPQLAVMNYFPIRIPAGSKVWARLASAVSADTCRVFIIPVKGPHGYPASYLAPRALAYGVVSASSRGTVVTSGAAVYGSDVQLTASTSRDHQLWSVQVDGGTDVSLANLGFVKVRLRIGSGGPTIGEWLFNVQTTTEMIGGPFPPFPVHKPVPAGSAIHAALDGPATSDSLAVIAYGM
jgi:hypothetical protein